MEDLNATPQDAMDNAEPAPKKKKKYSKQLREAQRIERAASKTRKRMLKAVLRGVETWESNRDRSAEKRKDGAVRDAMRNTARAYGDYVRAVSRMPEDMIRMMPKPSKKAMRMMYGRMWN